MDNYSLKYNVDIVFCIDVTGSMTPVLNTIKKNALNLYGDLKRAMENMDTPKLIDQMRIKVIAFRDYAAFMKDNLQPMLATDFFTLPADTDKFTASVNSLDAKGGGDAPEDALEALAFAIRSKWDTPGALGRQIIVLFTDTMPHMLVDDPPSYPEEAEKLQIKRSCPLYEKSMAKTFETLSSWWGVFQDSEYMSQRKKRLLLYAPDKGAWNTISDTWDNVIHYTVALNNGMADANYQQILDALAGSI